MTWGCDKYNSRVDRIDDFITENNVCLLNDGSYTYLHPATGTFTAIDLSLCSPDIIIILPRWNLNRAEWVQFDHLCKEKLTLDTIELYDEPIQKKRCKPSFNTKCKDALKARKSALVMFKTNITTDNISNFRVASA